jgi:catechol 2,3-dioxygenase-like lactoylglutathione lyase family enzyme
MHRGSQQTFSTVQKKSGRWLTLYLAAFALVDLGAGVQSADRLRFGLRGGWTRGARAHTHTHTSMTASEHVKFTASGYRRPLHWVLKIGSLEKSLAFFEKVLGMKVHRHEEFASGCEATCNGPYGGAWSKTMIGYNMEEKNFALELTYNYGISQYTPGNDLRFIALRKCALQADAGSLGYVIEKDRHSGNEVIVGPDGYRFMLVDTSEGDASEPFLFVSIHVADLAQALSFHTAILGAKNLSGNTPGSPPRDDAAVVGFSEEGTRIELVQLTPAMGAVDHGMASGRFATETEDGAPTYIAAKVKSAGVGTIQHGPIKLQPHNEEVVIVKDVDGYEYCFVDARGFTACVNVAYQHGGQTVDWAFRNKLLQASLAPENATLEVSPPPHAPASVTSIPSVFLS